ncbi:MAG TPA: hypothetical protein VK140_06055 [Ktedonobacteraceae bacterium]|nr:hypothetical protein [Ktedonobacteraceae bacterium]
MVARVLFPVLPCGGTRLHPHHRATIKAHLSPHHPPSPLQIIRPPISLPGLGDAYYRQFIGPPCPIEYPG